MLPKSKLQLIVFFLTDFVSAVLSVLCSFVISFSLRYHFINVTDNDFIFLVTATLLSFLIGFWITSSDKDVQDYSILRLFTNRIAAGIILFACFSMLIVAQKSIWNAYRFFLGLTTIFFIIFSFTFRLVAKMVLVRCYKNTRSAILTGIITVSDRASEFVEALQQQWTRKIIGIALVDRTDVSSNYLSVFPSSNITDRSNPPPSQIAGVPVKADFGSFIDWIRKDSLDEIFIDIPYDSGVSLLPFLESIESMGVVVHVNVPLCDAIAASPHLNLRPTLTTVNGKPMLTCAACKHDPIHLLIKRLMDFFIGLLGTILSAPIIAIIAIPLLIESPGPLIFKQKRVGKNGRTFNIYKLRSMYRDAEERKRALMQQNEMQGFMFKMKNDPRITKVGRFIRRTSIDELPQFWNILLGDMSFVGTRPPTVEEYNQYHSHHKRRLSMKPGLTGLWQVSGRSNITDFEEVVKLDCQYIDNWSLWLDIKIMLKTIGVVFRNRGAE